MSQPHYTVAMNEIIKELLDLVELLKKSNQSAQTDAEPSVQKAIDEVNNVIALLQFDDSDILDKLAYVFAEGSDVFIIAEANGWTDELKRMESVVSSHVGEIRSAQKNDPAYFGDVKASSADSYASAPGRLTISPQKWNDIKKAYQLGFFEKIALHKMHKRVQERLSYGDTQPAVVVSEVPFIVAAYSDEMDAVVLLSFPNILAQINNIKLHDKLVTVNSYGNYNNVASDIFVGKNYLGNWTDFWPLIGDLLSDDIERINQHKNNVPDFVWQYVRKLGEEYLREHRELARQGFWFVVKYPR